MLPPDDQDAERDAESRFGASEGIIRCWWWILLIWAVFVGVLLYGTGG